jgi:hypothetical protein
VLAGLHLLVGVLVVLGLRRTHPAGPRDTVRVA